MSWYCGIVVAISFWHAVALCILSWCFSLFHSIWQCSASCSCIFLFHGIACHAIAFLCSIFTSCHSVFLQGWHQSLHSAMALHAILWYWWWHRWHCWLQKFVMALATMAALFLFSKKTEEIHPSGIFVWFLQIILIHDQMGLVALGEGWNLETSSFPGEINLLVLCQNSHQSLCKKAKKQKQQSMCAACASNGDGWQCHESKIELTCSVASWDANKYCIPGGHSNWAVGGGCSGGCGVGTSIGSIEWWCCAVKKVKHDNEMNLWLDVAGRGMLSLGTVVLAGSFHEKQWCYMQRLQRQWQQSCNIWI